MLPFVVICYNTTILQTVARHKKKKKNCVHSLTVIRCYMRLLRTYCMSTHNGMMSDTRHCSSPLVSQNTPNMFRSTRGACTYCCHVRSCPVRPWELSISTAAPILGYRARCGAWTSRIHYHMVFQLAYRVACDWVTDWGMWSTSDFCHLGVQVLDCARLCSGTGTISIVATTALTL